MSDDQIIEYLRGRAHVAPPPDTVRSVMAAIDAAPAARRSWFASPLTIGIGVAVLVAVVLAGIALFSAPRVGPPGPVPDCESDPTGLVEYAMARLEDSPGYRWTETEEMWGFDPAFPVSADDPHLAYTGFTAEGAYLAPDRMRALTTDADDPERQLGVIGFPEVIHVGGHTYGYMPGGMTDEQGNVVDIHWQELPAEIGANRLSGAFPFDRRISAASASPDAVRTDPVQLTWEVPGEAGCIAWWNLDLGPDMPGSAVAPTIALRIDDQGQVVAGVYDGTNPDAPDEERMNNDLRWRFSVEYEVPDASEFERPEGPIYTYPPSQYPPSEAP